MNRPHRPHRPHRQHRPTDARPGRGTRRRRLGIVPVALLAAALFAGCLAGTSGTLDKTFGVDGVAAYIDGSNEARASAQQPDGKTIVAGTGYFPDGSSALSAVYVGRYDTAGRYDPTFGGTMVKVNVIDGAEIVRSVAVDSRGRILVAGYVAAPDYPDDTDVFVVRLTAAGQLDPTWDGDGIRMIDRSNHDRVGAVVPRGDRVLLAGSFDSGGSWANQWTVLALTDAGAADASFSGDGVAPVPTTLVTEFDRLRSLAVQPDGKLVLGGTANNEFVTARLTADGAVDAGWDGDGVARTLVGTGGEGLTVLLPADGKVVLTGYARPGGGRADEDMAAVRWTPTGALDPTFDGDGRVLADYGLQTNDRATSGALGADGKIVLGGFAYTDQGMDLAVFRLNHDGSLDTSFNGDGRTTTNYGPTANEQFESITVGPNGRLLGAGWFHDRWLLAGYDGGADVRLTVADASVVEPDAGTADLTFTVALSGAATTPVTVRYTTTNATAVAPGDYGPQSGTLTFAPGETSKAIRVPVQGDTAAEPDERLSLDLALPTNAGIADGSAAGTITNDD